MDKLLHEYERCLSKQVFDDADADCFLPETQHRPVLAQLAEVSGSIITVFDMRLRKHAFTSGNFFDLFGRDADIEGMEAKIHPDDMPHLLRHAILAARYAFSEKENMKNYKFVADYRICNASGKYVRIVEQQSVLEQDRAGNARLALSVLHMSPDQNPLKAVTCGVFGNSGHGFRPVRIHPETCASVALSPRETEILQLVGAGLPSKEIADRLCISIHTVNTHRQRILEKLGVDNSMEAVRHASTLGLPY
ncbi:MAG: LuxR C-terminal-related transcriptional regulator [Tannerella sp.]|jgi:DNA-binding CsgD family transcriptional regulator|nr:LuxR C-terminal-related transcriptional regulator [Tannerella sp.]